MLDRGFAILTGNNPTGTFVCVYKLYIGETKISQRHEPIERTNLSTVFYFYDQSNFNLNCSKKKNDLTHLKTIVLGDERIEVEDLDDAVISLKNNLKSKENFVIYDAKNPSGKFVCIYKVTVGEIEVSQTYEPITIKNLAVVEYSFNELGYKTNCSLHFSRFTHLREITFKDDNRKVINLELSKGKAIGRFKLERDLVINTKRNPNGTLFRLYYVSI